MNGNKFAPVAPWFRTDAYKQSHINLFPKNTKRTYSNYTNRSTRIAGTTHVVNFGLQAWIKQLNESFELFFATDVDLVCDLYAERVKSYLGVAEVNTDHVRALHELGYLPLRFKEVAEGALVPLGVPTLTVENTHPDFAFLTNFIESDMSANLWHVSSVATLSAYDRKKIEKWRTATGCDFTGIEFQYHDFSYRGQTSTESAAASGAGHLLSFLGSDTLPTLDWVDTYYDGDNGLVLASVPATEHAVMSTGTAYESEEETYRKILTDHFPTGIVSLVSDTYSIWNVVEPGGILDRLRTLIMGRDGKLVIRPDSGDPADIICGTNREFGKGKNSEEKGVIELLFEVFGGTENAAGFKELDQHIGMIYGDGITPARMEDIFARLAAKGFAATNVTYGVGSYRYQVISRDSVGGSAVKMTWAEIDGLPYNVKKDPITAKGGKTSATGRLAVFLDAGNDYELIQDATPEQEEQSELKTVWEDGRFVVHQSLADARRVLAEQNWKIKDIPA